MTYKIRRVELALLAVFIVSGFAGLIYQAVWSHYLGLTLGHAAYAQSLVLGIFMGGMALGALLASRVAESRRRLIMAYAVIEGIVGIRYRGVGFPRGVRRLHRCLAGHRPARARQSGPRAHLPVAFGCAADPAAEHPARHHLSPDGSSWNRVERFL